VAILMEGVGEETIEALVRFNRQLGLDLLTGEGWVLLAGSRSRLAAFARPWALPPELTEFATAIGRVIPGEVIGSWLTARGAMALDRPRIAGILNITPDSFSDGGRYATPDQAIAHAEELLDAGADWLDVGGESTRPGATPVPEDEEIARVRPIVQALVRRFPRLILSVDTVKAGVARAALEVGAAAINDVSGLRLDPAMGQVVSQAGAGMILMHSRGTVSDMASYANAEYGPDVIPPVLDELAHSLEQALSAGIGSDAIVLDPGLGFSKTREQSLRILDELRDFLALDRPLLVGPSRKRFLGSGDGASLDERDEATATACVMAYERGAQLFRVHNVGMVRKALRLAESVRGQSGAPS
jgi:dihydropteroate synthase